MKVKNIVNDFLINSSPMHKMRRLALVECINSIVNGNSLTVTSMGRGIESKTFEKHSIKRSDRLCSNDHLHKERTQIYGGICKLWIPASARPVILVDWSDLDDCKNAFLISATLACDGRSITLYLEVHPLNKKEKPAIHKAFLATLASLLPVHCRPIIVADAGFKVPWHQMVLALGWDHVGRVRKPNFYKIEGENKDWQSVNVLFKQATSTAQCFRGQLTRSNRFDTTFVLYKGAAKGRHKLTAEGKRCRSKHSQQQATGGSEPWLLTSSLPVTSQLAKQVVNIYSSTKQIEERYRDMKSKLYGLGFNESESYKIKRIEILMLVAVLATMVLLLIGAAAEQAGFARHFQANTIKKRRVISLQYLGLRMIANPHLALEQEHFVKAVMYMKYMIT